MRMGSLEKGRVNVWAPKGPTNPLGKRKDSVGGQRSKTYHVRVRGTSAKKGQGGPRRNKNTIDEGGNARLDKPRRLSAEPKKHRSRKTKSAPP